MEQLIQSLIGQHVLKTPHIIEAFKEIDRKDFVPEEYKNEAYIDTALPTTEEQTISQPYTVAFMLELLEPQKGNKILDVGSGSGWQTAMLAHIVGPKGKIFGIEKVSTVKKMGDENIAKYNFIKKGIVINLEMNAKNGIPQEAPFDRIIAAAAAEEVPDAWKNQVKIGGRIVLPIGNTIRLFIKQKDNLFDERVFPGFVFVPFVKE